MKTAALSLLLIMLLAATGCSKRQSVIIDPEGVDMAQYQKDLVECQQLAQQVESQTGEGAAGGAVVGGLLGAVAGGDRSVERTAGMGAVLGGARGAQSTREEREQVVKNCLRNRGYKVLN